MRLSHTIQQARVNLNGTVLLGLLTLLYTHIHTLILHIQQPRVNVDGTVSVEDAETSELVWHGYPDEHDPSNAPTTTTHASPAHTKAPADDIAPAINTGPAPAVPPRRSAAAHTRQQEAFQEEQSASSPKESESEETKERSGADVSATSMLADASGRHVL